MPAQAQSSLATGTYLDTWTRLGSLACEDVLRLNYPLDDNKTNTPPSKPTFFSQTIFISILSQCTVVLVNLQEERAGERDNY